MFEYMYIQCHFFAICMGTFIRKYNVYFLLYAWMYIMHIAENLYPNNYLQSRGNTCRLVEVKGCFKH